MRIASQHGHPASRSYRGVSYLVDTSGGNGAAAVVGQLVAIASNETILKQLIDAQQGAASLANDASYRGVLAHLSGGASLGTLYVAPSALLDALQRGHRLPAGTATVLRTVFSFLGGQAFAGGLAVTPNAISLQTASVGGRAGPPSGAASGADLVAAMPGDTWLGIGISDLGGKINRVLRAIINIGQLGGVNVGAQLNRAFAGSGFNLQRDLLSWIGSTGLFVRGTSLANLGGALVIHSKNAARSRAAVAKLERLVRRLGRRSGTVRPLSRPGVDAGFSFTPRTVPLTFDVADGQGKFVIALGDAALAEALHPSGALTGNADYKAAGAALGGGLRPSVFFDFGPVVTLLDNLGLNASNPTYQRARPTLQALSVLAAGGSHSGDVSSNRLTLALH